MGTAQPLRILQLGLWVREILNMTAREAVEAQRNYKERVGK